MSAHRFYIAPEAWNPNALVLTGSEAHHARDVLRLKPGDKAVLFNGRGREVTAQITEANKREIRLRKMQEAESATLRCRITLGQAIPKGKNMDLIVQKAVEIGAAGIAPLISERTIVDLDPEEAAQKQAKWQQVAIEAAKQCGQNWLPQVHLPRTLKQFFSEHEPRETTAPRHSDSSLATRHSSLSSLRLIGSLQSDARHLKKVLADWTNEHPPSQGYGAAGGDRPTNVLMLIGPEGDFTPAELALARSHGCQPITLGPIILRVQTAAIYCLSVLSYELLG